LFRKLRLIFILLFAAVYCGYAQAPVAVISAIPTKICPGQAISFTGSSSGGVATSYSWTFPTGAPGTWPGQSVAVIFSTPGTYTISLTESNASGSNTATTQITVYSVPIADFSQDKDSGCFPIYVQFTNKSTGAGITSYSWSFGDGTQDTAASPNHHYTVGGTLPVTLYVKNSFGCVGTAQIKNVQKAIHLTGQVISNFSYSLNSSCTLPVTATFTNTSTGPGILSYLWDFGDGSGPDNTFAPSHLYNTAGNDTARLTVTSNQGCSDIMKVPVTISSSGNISDFTMPDTVCVNTVVDFTNISSPYPNRSDWLYGDGSPADLNKHNGQHTYTVPGTYPVKLTNTFPLCGGTNTKNIVVVAPPVTSFTGTNLTSCKAPLTSIFTDASVGATSWTWDFGDASPKVNGQGPQSHTYNKIGDFTVTLSTSAVSGCSSSKTLMVHIDTPIVKIVGMPAYGCAPYTFSPTASVTTIDGVASYSWIMGNGNTSTSATPPPQTYPVGTFTMYCTITTTGGCVAKDSGIIKVGSVKPVPSFTWAPPTICVKTFVNFSGLAPGADQWKWDFGDGSTNTTTPSPIYRYTKPGTYTVKFTAYNSGCWDTISHTVVVDAPLANFSYSSILCSKNNYLFNDKSVGPPTGWQWDFGDGGTSVAPNPTHSYAAGAPTNYTAILIASTATCKDTISVTVKVNQTTTLAFSPSSSICVNTPVTVTATAFGNIGKYIWVYGDGTRDTTTGNSATHTYLTPNAAYQVKVITIDPTSGCVDSSAAYTMTVNGPTAFFSGPPLLSCGAITVNFKDLSTVTAGSSIVKWAWDFGDGGTSTSPSPSYTYTNQGNFVARLTVTDNNGCSSTYDTAKPLTVSIMIPKYTLSDTLTCPNAPQQTKFINSSIGGFNPIYTWDFGDGSGPDHTVSPNHVYASVNRFYDTLMMTDTYGCVAKFGGPSIRVDTPYAAFTMSGNFSTCPVFNDTFHFTGHYALSYSWVFDDGGISVLPTPINGYALPGYYNPYLDIISPGGCVSRSATQQVHILGPTGNLVYSPTAACDSLTVNFSVAPTNAVSFSWIPGDGSPSVPNMSPTFQYTYKTPGQYTPVVFMTDAAGCTLSQVGKTFINIDAISSASFIADKYIVCDTGIVNFKNTSVIGNGTKITDFRWDFGDGATTNGPGDSLISHNYTTLGKDSVALTLTSFAGCSATHKVAVEVVPSPKISFTGLVNQCEPAVLSFGGVESPIDPNGPLTWSWVFGNGQTASGQNQPGISYPKAGEYVVYATAKNAKGCITMTDTAGPATHLFIYPIPSVNAGIDATICDTSSLQLNATGTATSYTWDPPSPPGNLSTLVGPNPVATSPVSTFFVVKGTTLFGCAARDTINVTVNGPLTVTATGTDSVCIGQSANLNATGAAQYTWTPSAGLNNPNIANPVATPDSSQIGAGSSAVLTYSVTGTDNKKCYSDTKTVDITAFKNPVIGLIPNATINVGSSYQINSTASTNIISLNWTPTNNLSCTNCLTPVANPTMTTKYSLTATNDGGCATTESIRVQVICTGANFFVPNSFSPNGDGVNDYFIVNGVGLNVIPSITIYNRWGQMVFQKSNFAPNSASQAWDGTFNGKPAPADVYVYTIQILCENATLIPYHGNVTLIR
jgi:gliding motility-associated-like protein